MRKPMLRSNNRIVCSKQMGKLILEAEKELSEEGHKQIVLVNSACAIALSKYWGFGSNRIAKIFDIENEIFAECSSDVNTSLLSILDEECDIQLTNKEGVSYRDFAYLNIEKEKWEKYTAPQILTMRRHQKEWFEAQVTAAVCLALHRKEGWGFKRIRELLEHMQDIKEQYDYHPARLIEAVNTDTSFDWDNFKFDIA